MNISSKPTLPPGKHIAGKWNGKSYKIEHALGEGANGKVYLVSRNNAVYAMKIGSDPLDLQSEVNILTVLSGMEGSFRHFLMDVDDFCDEAGDKPFYIMKYVEGVQLQAYLAAKGKGWFPLVGLRILDRLRELHSKGYVFGDLKKENVLVSGYGQVELVDFGGVTSIGKAVKQFTELYDRGYWNAGDRTADGGYDLFSFAILCIHLCAAPKPSFSKAILPQNRNLEVLLAEVRQDPLCADYVPFLSKALHGKFASTDEAYDSWREIAVKRPVAQPAVKHGAPWLPVGFAASLLLFGATLWYYW
ncbi:MAG: serine/threonine protein kinase [Paenibacillaceae bacterium]|nr:serine/threonine protein kinase [Paenibacillaceae bacterium]